ncbi:exported hypothetical protein [Vibrio crassostreae]|nr:exported hypothetical protein [Vibrio crassostreae]CDT54069.1 exported hypothetical protein [Vibrio crassostreae]CDT59800.1 exported hypothetical protein [Vibrio crassostreae]CDT68852.1 exported hypothetical protein [Vibrio crassostreae]
MFNIKLMLTMLVSAFSFVLARKNERFSIQTRLKIHAVINVSTESVRKLPV